MASDPPSRPAVRALLEREGHYLLLLAAAGGRRKWVLPGGVVESGETPREALHREVLSTLGLELTVGDPVGAFAFTNERLDVHVVNTVFEASTADPEAAVALPDDGAVVAAEWVTPQELGELALASGEGAFFERYLEDAPASTGGGPVGDEISEVGPEGGDGATDAGDGGIIDAEERGGDDRDDG